MNIKKDLIETLKTQTNWPTKFDAFEFNGVLFPLKTTKRFLSTFKKDDELIVMVSGEELRFYWSRNGFAFINSVARYKELSQDNGK